LLASCAASPPAAAFVPWSSLLGEPAGDYTIEACLSAECFRFWLAKDNKERKQKTSKENSLCLLYRRILTSVATQKCQKINPPTRQDRNPDSYDIHSRSKSHNLSRNANSQKQSDFYSSTAAGAPSLPPFPRSRSSAIRSLSTQQQENTQNAGEGGKKTEKNHHKRKCQNQEPKNHKNQNQNCQESEPKTKKKKKNCKNNNNKTKLLSQQTTQTKQSEAREKIEMKELVKNYVPPDATPTPPPPPSSHSKQNQTRLL
jgi:hypothetical protein